ncbi:MAG: PAS domain S-box protein [Breznakibacter sp.]
MMISPEDLLFALDSTEDVVVMTDLTGNITYANKAFETVYGYKRHDVLGKNMCMLKSGFHPPEFYQNMWETILNGETWEGETKNKTRENRCVWEKSRISPIKRPDGQITGFISVKENITYKKELDEQLAQEQFLLSELFSNSPVGITICQPIVANDEIVDVLVLKSNPIASNILNRLGLVGLSLRKLFPSSEFDAQLFNQMTGEKLNFEAYLSDVDKHLSFRTFPLFENRFCALFIDVTNYKQTIKALVESEERYSSLVGDSPVLICRFNSKGLVIYANSWFEVTYGVHHNELIGTEFYSFFEADIRQSVQQKIESLSIQSPQTAFEQQVLILDQPRWQRWVIRALLNKQGNIFEYQAVGMDFTEIKEAERVIIESRNKLNAIFNNSIMAVNLVDIEGGLKMVNSRMCEMLGYTEDELLGISPPQLTHPDDLPLTQMMFERIFSGEVDHYSLEKRSIRKDGSVFWVNLFVSPIKDANGNIKEIVGLFADIDEKKRIELQLVENERKLKELNATKDKLFSIIAHDIKNPFHAILGLSSLLSQRIDDFSKDEIREFVDRILEAGENTYKLLEDLLTWGRSQLGKLTVSPRWVQPAKIIDEIFATYKTMATGKHITLSNQIDHTLLLWVDDEMLKFMLRNLIHNGLKFTPEGGNVTCFRQQEASNGYAVIGVRDNGIGIRPQKLAVLFDINAFLSTMGTADEKGTGLGLSLTHEMVGINRGQITVESEVGKGTVFYLTLPVSDSLPG